MASAVETIIRRTVGLGVTALADFNRKRLPEPTAPHPFLTGIHTPMTEEKTIETLAVTGTIPAGLDGRYLRIGPNPVAADPASYHWFVGDGMVHGVALKDGQALWYRNRWINSHKVAALLGRKAAPGRAMAASTRSTPMCWALPGAPSRWSRRAAIRSS